MWSSIPKVEQKNKIFGYLFNCIICNNYGLSNYPLNSLWIKLETWNKKILQIIVMIIKIP